VLVGQIDGADKFGKKFTKIIENFYQKSSFFINIFLQSRSIIILNLNEE